MILKYSTGKLPPNFIYFGYMLFGLGIWRMAVSDWKGIMFFIISVVFLFLRSGIIIDTDNRKLKKWIGIQVSSVFEKILEDISLLTISEMKNS